MQHRSLQFLFAALVAPAALAAQGVKCAPDNAGLKLPPGFCATIFADTVRGARELTVASNGDVLVSSQGQRGQGGGVVLLRDTNNDGVADVREQFASGFNSSHLGIFDGYLYVEGWPSGGGRGAPNPPGSIVRYAYTPGATAASGTPDTIVKDIPRTGNHTTRNFAITNTGILYMNIGSATNSCQDPDRKAKIPGVDPCVELNTRAGVWKFDARKKDQTPDSLNHFAKGIRNAVGIAINPADSKLWTTQHGRDQLGGEGGTWTFSAKYNSENPAEELMQVNQGDDFGWPYCYFSVEEKHLVLAPEYGGDGKKTERCAQKKEPVAYFPGHWAPNALLFYTGSKFPAKYKNGAFIAFHGSWNRTGEAQAGYNVVFQPLTAGKSAGAYQVFAQGFSPNSGGATGNHRPTGLAVGTDGSIYVSDDAGGRIYKIVYTGK
jgi:glucose/arabinose dehydrogenase